MSRRSWTLKDAARRSASTPTETEPISEAPAAHASFAALLGEVEQLKASRQLSLPAPVAPHPGTQPPCPELVVEECNGVAARHPSYPRRKLAALARGPILPFYELDLHGLTRKQTRSALAQALPTARRNKHRSVLIICGKGRHSGPAGAVLPEYVVGLLRGPLRHHLHGFCSAPEAWGGAGALLVAVRAAEE